MNARGLVLILDVNMALVVLCFFQQKTAYIKNF